LDYHRGIAGPRIIWRPATERKIAANVSVFAPAQPAKGAIMPPFVNYRCQGCETDNSIEAPSADVVPDDEVHCSHCGKSMGRWRDLAIGDDGSPLTTLLRRVVDEPPDDSSGS
jgi:hypothetical protein